MFLKMLIVNSYSMDNLGLKQFKQTGSIIIEILQVLNIFMGIVNLYVKYSMQIF